MARVIVAIDAFGQALDTSGTRVKIELKVGLARDRAIQIGTGHIGPWPEQRQQTS